MTEQIIRDLDDENLLALMRDRTAADEDRLDAASEIGSRKARAAEERHAAFHGHPLRYGRVERRRGYRSEIRCLDCYYGKEWTDR